ncbi:RAVE subunit 2/Rogdi [Dipodascopsis uninucleata]
MTTAVNPIQDTVTALNEEHKVSILELAWLLNDLASTIESFSSGIEECISLLEADQPGSTLVLSSNRSEALKGFVVRVGHKIVKADIHIKLSSLNKGQQYDLTLQDGKYISLAQLGDCSNFLHICLRTVKEMEFIEPPLVLSQLRKLLSNIRYAHLSVQSVSPVFQFPYSAIDSSVFAQEYPENLSLDLTVSESGVIADIRTLQFLDGPPQPASSAASATSTTSYRKNSMNSPTASVYRSLPGTSHSIATITNSAGTITPRNGTISSNSPISSLQTQSPQRPLSPPPAMGELRRTNTNVSTTSSVNSKMTTASTASTMSWLGGLISRRRPSDPLNKYVYKGYNVRSLERITVQSFDPGLMALTSKLNVLELNIGQALRKLEVAMNWK